MQSIVSIVNFIVNIKLYIYKRFYKNYNIYNIKSDFSHINVLLLMNILYTHIDCLKI